jgi:hypothetical protein
LLAVILLTATARREMKPAQTKGFDSPALARLVTVVWTTLALVEVVVAV